MQSRHSRWFLWVIYFMPQAPVVTEYFLMYITNPYMHTVENPLAKSSMCKKLLYCCSLTAESLLYNVQCTYSSTKKIFALNLMHQDLYCVTV